MSKVIESIERAQLRKVPRFKAGDTVRVHFQVIEGQRRRVQVFEGIVIKRQGAGVRETFTVRKNSFGVGVERTFPVHSPKIEKIDVAAIGDVNRAKLYYLRGRVGKKARVREQRYSGAKPHATSEPLRLCPENWLEGATTKQLIKSLLPILDLPLERILVSHGDPVLQGGKEVLRALIAPEKA